MVNVSENSITILAQFSKLRTMPVINDVSNITKNAINNLSLSISFIGLGLYVVFYFP